MGSRLKDNRIRENGLPEDIFRESHLSESNHNYWTGRAAGYSQVNQDELRGVQNANWYAYLYDEEARREYERDRLNVEARGFEDHYTCTDIDAMESIALRMPLSRIRRPEWDRDVLGRLGMRTVDTYEDMGGRVWSEVEKVNYSATPMFMIAAVR